MRPNYMFAHNNLGLALVKTGDISAAAEEFKQALALAPEKIDVELNLAVSLNQLGQFEESLQHFRHAAKLHPESLLAWTETAKLEAKHGSLQNAELAATKALELEPQNRDLQRLYQVVKSLRAKAANSPQ